MKHVGFVLSQVEVNQNIRVDHLRCTRPTKADQARERTGLRLVHSMNSYMV